MWKMMTKRITENQRCLRDGEKDLRVAEEEGDREGGGGEKGTRKSLWKGKENRSWKANKRGGGQEREKGRGKREKGTRYAPTRAPPPHGLKRL